MAEKKKNQTILHLIKTLYLSIASGIGLVVTIVGLIGGIDLLLRETVFVEERVLEWQCQPNQLKREGGPYASMEECKIVEMEQLEIRERNQFRRNIASYIAMAVIGLPVWLIHFYFLRADWRRFE